MTRTLIGFSLLIALLAAGFFVQVEMERIHQPIARMLDVSAEDSLDDDWESARDLSASAARRWRERWKFSAAFADHEPMEEIDSLFARLEVCAREEDTLEYAAVCRELARRIDAMAEAHMLTWWNLF